MKCTIEEVQKYIESLGHYKDVVFVEEIEGDCMFFDTFNPDGVDVSIRADVEKGVNMNSWNIYECCDDYDWNFVEDLYQSTHKKR
jgi:hypothetical protein